MIENVSQYRAGHQKKNCPYCMSEFADDSKSYCPNAYNICKDGYKNMKTIWKKLTGREKCSEKTIENHGGVITPDSKYYQDFHLWYKEVYFPKNKSEILRKKAEKVALKKLEVENG